MANTVFKDLRTNEVTLVTTNAKLYDGIVNGRVKPLIGDEQLKIDNIKVKNPEYWKSYHLKLRERLANDANIELLEHLNTHIKNDKTKIKMAAS
ncbi:hypothetical protein MA9V1_101 [Chryseobacterium phage MA9V-1]|nr:hypothetical protein MA9V1_101 [Chryseobacterium phage MA9V-1]